jgi:hypothetical protein
LALQMQTFQDINDSSLHRQDDGEVQVVADALDLYRSVLWRRWWSVLISRPHCRPAFDQPEAKGIVRGGYSVGVCAVPIRQIRCSESRSEDFDADLRPLQERTQGRWLSIARARLMGVAMPPVELLQVRDVYCVRDGHHRISVAGAMGQEYVEGEVLVWELGAQPLCERPAAVPTPKPKVLTTKTKIQGGHHGNN